MRSASFFPLALLGMIACGTIASPGGGDLHLPTADVGPFSALAKDEVAPGDEPPFVFSNESAQYRDPCIIPESPGASGPGVILFAVATGSSGDVIVRTRADDGRSFYGDSVDAQNTHPSHVAPVVLHATQQWEGRDLSGPSALRVGSDVWLYYAGAGGIGLAVSNDGGKTFQPQAGPVLGAADGVAWEFTPPRAPSVAVFPDGTFHMLYASGNAVGEAMSADGKAWRRVDADPTTPAFDPVLVPSAHVDPSTLPVGVPPPFDEGAVDDPLLVPTVDVAGRLVLHALYTGYSAPLGAKSRTSAIGIAGRLGTSGRFTKQPDPAYNVQSGEAAPALLQFGDEQALLYVQQANTSVMPSYLSIAAAYAPASGMLGAPGAFPTSP
jgi:hypothetical protein